MLDQTWRSGLSAEQARKSLCLALHVLCAALNNQLIRVLTGNDFGRAFSRVRAGDSDHVESATDDGIRIPVAPGLVGSELEAELLKGDFFVFQIGLRRESF